MSFEEALQDKLGKHKKEEVNQIKLNKKKLYL